MSLTADLIAIVKQRGHATADDLCPMFPSHSRAQVLKALQNAKTTRQLTSDGHVALRGSGGGPGSACATYRPIPDDEAEMVTRRRRSVVRYASVFHYAQGIEVNELGKQA